jgi:hypothetical protein
MLQVMAGMPDVFEFDPLDPTGERWRFRRACDFPEKALLARKRLL